MEEDLELDEVKEEENKTAATADRGQGAVDEMFAPLMTVSQH